LLELTFDATQLYAILDNFYYSSDSNEPNHRWTLATLAQLPKEQWISFVVFYKQGTGFRVQDGKLIVWIDGAKKLDVGNVPTGTQSGTPFVIWGIGLYGGPNNPVGQFERFKDVTVTSQRLEN